MFQYCIIKRFHMLTSLGMDHITVVSVEFCLYFNAVSISKSTIKMKYSS